eukprot:scaffold100450_cov41-Prasinocladus_malaysianus.AAC.1
MNDDFCPRIRCPMLQTTGPPRSSQQSYRTGCSQGTSAARGSGPEGKGRCPMIHLTAPTRRASGLIR